MSDFWSYEEAATRYGLFNGQEGGSGRANVTLDENQKVAFIKIYEISTVPDINEILDFQRIFKLTRMIKHGERSWRSFSAAN